MTDLTNFTGFETGDALECAAALTGTASVQSGVILQGAYSLRSNPATTGTGYATVSMFLLATGGQDTLTEVDDTYTRFYFRVDTLPAANSEEIAVIRTNIAPKLHLRVNSSGNLMAFGDDGTTQIGSTGSTVLATDGTVYRIEVHVGINSGLTGPFTIKLAVGDGTAANEITGTGDIGNSGGNRAYLGKANNRNGQSVDFYYDDVAFSTAGYPGPGHTEIMIPDGDGTYTAWTIGAGGGADWTNVDDPVINDGNTTYLLSTSSDGDASTVTLESTASAGISGTIHAAKAIAICARNGSGTRLYNVRLRSGGTDSDTTDYTADTAYTLQAKIFNTDPNTSAAWTTSGLDAVEVGVVEAAAAATKTRCTALGLMVDFGPAATARSWGTIF